ncbi:helix-turn-helix domain-containing protein [Pseudomonas sp. AF03-9]|uniref:helix-turn-helix domain-containing protein n=1 Tax=Pseudomonas sp. AF03-9 TaxID=2849867 RepID=UPI001CFA46D8|nr:helix-turn-helix transcriptional regulator [Pseudomonas sp. AF03-9]
MSQLADLSFKGIHSREKVAPCELKTDSLRNITTLARESGISRTYLYGLAAGASQDPSVHTLIKLAKALQVSPLRNAQ